MASSFMGLYVQRDGLNMAQKALDITGSNISNTQTPGYTRQRLDIVSVKNNNRTLGYKNQVFLAGAGTEAPGVEQVRDDILDTKFRRHTTIQDDYNVKSAILGDIENAIDDIENSETGFAHSIESFKAAWQAFSSAGTDQTDIANVALNAAENVVNVLRNFDMRISSISDDTLTDLNTSVKRVNEILEQCAAINKDIKAGYVNNANFYDNGYGYQADTNYGPLEVKDQMNSLIDELSGYANISSTVEADGTYTISIAGKTAVKNDEYAKLTADKKLERVTETDENGNTIEHLMFDDMDPTDFSYSISDLKTNHKWKTARWETEGFTGDDLKYRQEINSKLEEGHFEEARKLEDDYIGDNSNGYRKESLFANDAVTHDAYGYVMTDKVTGGALKGLTDMYNGEGYYTSGALGKNGYAESGKGYYTVENNYNEKDPTVQQEYKDPNDPKVGNTYKGVPFYRDVINQLAKSVAEEFNKIYAGVKNEDGEEFKLFEFADGGVSIDYAKNIKTSEVWKDNPIRSVHPEYGKGTIFDGSDITDSKFDELSNEWVNKILGVFETKHSIGEESLQYKFEDYVSHYGNIIGSHLESNKNVAKSNEILLNSITDARDEVMKVSTDEEGIHMLTYQKWYNAMARMVTTLDSALDKLINNTGTVGL